MIAEDFEVSGDTESPVETHEPAAAAPAVGLSSEETAAVDDGVDTSPAAVEPDPASTAGKELAKKRGSLQGRIDELTREKHTTRREAEAAKAEAMALRAEIAALKSPKAAETYKAEDGEPTYEAFVKAHPDHADPYAGYLREVAKWDLKQELAKERAASTASDAQRAQSSALETFQKAGNDAHADFDAKMQAASDAGIVFTPMLANALLRDPDGHELAYLLVADVDAAKKMAAIADPVALGKALGKLSQQLEAATTGPTSSDAPKTNAKPPLKPVGSSPVNADDSEVPDDLPVEEHIRRMNARDRKNRQ